MKKIAIIAIAVLFWLVGLCYAQDVAGPLSMLNFKITYEEYVPATKTMKDGIKLITVMSGLNQVVSGSSVYEPAIYIKQDPATGLISRIWISWLDPNINDINLYNTRILTIACSGGNTSASIPTPGLPEPTDGLISTKKQLPVKNTPTTRTDSFQGVAGCHICPNGFGFLNGTLTGLCNDGSSYVNGYISYSGKSTRDLTTKETISASISATVGAGGFNYIGEDWAVALDPTTHLSAKDCDTFNGVFPYCDAVLGGTLKATVIPCTNANPSWTNCPSQ